MISAKEPRFAIALSGPARVAQFMSPNHYVKVTTSGMKIEKEVLKVCKRTAERLQSTVYKFLLLEDSVEEIAPRSLEASALVISLPNHLIA